MATPTSTTPWENSTFTGVGAVDALLGGTQWSGHSITFSFADYGSSWGTAVGSAYGPSAGAGEPWSDRFEPLDADQQDAARAALATWAAVANLKFVESVDTEAKVGDIRFAFTSDPDAQAHAFLPYDGPKAGDVWISAESTSHGQPWSLGSYSFETVIHELGHAIGLKHPFEPLTSNPGTIDRAYDTRSFTIMSYSAEPGDKTTYFSYEPTTPMILDIAAVQHLYGANQSHRSGNDNYVFREGETYHQTIWDAGGKDTFTYKSSVGGEIDLNAGVGGGSQMGQDVAVLNRSGSVLHTVYSIWIAYDTVIESAIGGSGSDLILGNEAANRLEGRGGNDVIAAGAGSDTILGGAGKDAIGGGAGKDRLEGGSGADQFVLDSRVGRDTVLDFVRGSDRVALDQDSLGKLGDGDARVEGATVRKSAGGFSEQAELTLFANDIRGSITTAKAAAAIGSAKDAFAKGDKAIFVVDNGEDSGVFLFSSSSANAAVSANELTLLAILTDVAATTTGDYLFLT